jgi:hypothetical protein
MRPPRLATILGLTVLLALVAPVDSYELIDYGGGPCHWPEATTRMYLHETSFPVASSVGNAAKWGLDSWTAVSGCAFYFSVNFGSSGFGWITNAMVLDGYNDVAGVRGYLDQYTYAATWFVYNYNTGSDVLIDTDVLFNYDLIWSTTGHPSYPDMETVAVHEFGHVVGLDHVMDPSTVMYPYGASGLIKRDLAPDDEEGIRFLYPAEEEPPEDPPPNVETKLLVLTHAGVSALDAYVGDTVRVTGVVRNASDVKATVSSVVMSPRVVVLNQTITVEPEEEASLDLVARVTAPPGTYPTGMRVIGYDGSEFFSSALEDLHSRFDVRRGTLGYTMQDSLSEGRQVRLEGRSAAGRARPQRPGSPDRHGFGPDRSEAVARADRR